MRVASGGPLSLNDRLELITVPFSAPWTVSPGRTIYWSVTPDPQKTLVSGVWGPVSAVRRVRSGRRDATTRSPTI